MKKIYEYFTKYLFKLNPKNDNKNKMEVLLNQSIKDYTVGELLEIYELLQEEYSFKDFTDFINHLSFKNEIEKIKISVVYDEDSKPICCKFYRPYTYTRTSRDNYLAFYDNRNYWESFWKYTTPKHRRKGLTKNFYNYDRNLITFVKRDNLIGIQAVLDDGFVLERQSVNGKSDMYVRKKS